MIIYFFDTSKLFSLGKIKNLNRLAEFNTHWEKHPDGIGYVIKWIPLAGDIYLVWSNQQVIGELLNQANIQLMNYTTTLRKKEELGEIDNKTAEKQIYEKILELQKDLKTRVLKL